MDADRRVDRLAILRGNGPQRDEDFGLREDIFVQDRGPLGDQRHADATRSAAARVRVDGASSARAATQPWSAATPWGCEWHHSGRRWPGRPGRHQVKKRIRLLELRNGLLKLGLKLRAQSAQFLRGNVPSLSLLFLPTFEQLQQSLRARH